MKLGVVFPQPEVGTNPVAIRDFALAAEAVGFDHLHAYDHVLGVHPDHYAGQRQLHNFSWESQVHEPFVLFGYIASVTRRLELVTSILILPQRQTALVAKQAAAVDVLSGGRLRLGVGLGWCAPEFAALNADFHTRGRRVEEQIEVLRRLWTEPLVTYDGKWHHIDRAGINPLPVQRPIPIWMGSEAPAEDRVLQRIARLADGWLPLGNPTEELVSTLERLRGFVEAGGRDPAGFGVEGRINVARSAAGEWPALAEHWRLLGVTHLSVSTMGAGFTSVQQHIEVLQRWKEAVAAIAAPA